MVLLTNQPHSTAQSIKYIIQQRHIPYICGHIKIKQRNSGTSQPKGRNATTIKHIQIHTAMYILRYSILCSKNKNKNIIDYLYSSEDVLFYLFLSLLRFSITIFFPRLNLYVWYGSTVICVRV